MNTVYQSELFRLAVVLYADNNYEVSSKTVNKKIIESVLIECGKKELTIHEIIDFIHDHYNLVYDEQSIEEIVSNPKYDFLTSRRDNNKYVSLSGKRRLNLLSKINNKTIDYFIAEFQKEYSELTNDVDYKSIIYKYIYEVFIANSIGFGKLLDNTKILNKFNLESNAYTDEEKEIINTFLQWDNAEKNKTIFDIASYSVEYCMLTNKSGKHSIHLNDLRNKNFYLDTNIIYRGLGINGDDRKKRTSTFLKKFNEAGENLFISRATDLEFKEGIRGHIAKIKKLNSPRVNSHLYQEIAVQNEIFNFYHEWRIDKINPNIDLFLAYIFSSYDAFVKKFNIEIEIIPPYDLKEQKVDDKLREYSSSIYNFKSQNIHEVVGSSFVDAENIFLIEKKRDGRSHNMFQTKYFFISTDQNLRRWDYQRSNQTPIVLLPSQWMSIILRYVNRTEDDYKSFVSFLNLRNNEVLIDNEKLQIVLAGISEITIDIQQQRSILNNLVENRFNGILSKDISNEQLYDNVKIYAETQLEKEINDLKKSNEEIIASQETSVNAYKENSTQLKQEIQKISTQKDSLNQEVSLVKSENTSLKNELVENFKRQKMSQWKRTAYWCIPLIFLALLFYYFQIFHTDWKYNYIEKLVISIDSLQSDTKKGWIRHLINAVMLLGLYKPATLIYYRFFSKVKKNEKEKEIIKNLPEKYK